MRSASLALFSLGSLGALLIACSSSGGASAGDGGALESGASSSSSGSSSGGSSGSGSGGGASSGGGVHGRTSIAWAIDYPDDVFTAIAAHVSSFTHVATMVYEVASYTGGGVAPFWNTPGGADVFQNGLTSTTMAEKVHAMGLKYLAAVAGGAEMSETNVGIMNIVGDSPAGTQAGFITAMVSEGRTKGYDGYALDWEMGGAPTGQVIDYATYGVKMESFLAAFKSALHAKGMILTVAFVPNDVKQSCTSYGNGVWDLTEFGKNVDLAMLEDYATTLGTPTASCPATFTDPSGCYPGTVFGPFVDEVAMLCSVMAPSSVNITMNAYSMMTNPFAGDAVKALEAYGVESAGLFPQINSDGPGGAYAIYETKGIAPVGSDWFALMGGYLGK